MKLSKTSMLGILLAVYCLVCWWVLEGRNRAVPGGVLQQYHAEYAEGGSKKWRFSMDEEDSREPLHRFITTFGWVVYPVAIGGVLFFGVRVTKREDTVVSGVVVAICVLVLLRFVQMGVWSAAWEL